jgi:DNA-binding CsgD family transcriptional regulator
MRLGEEAFTELRVTDDTIGFHERAGLRHQIGLHIGHDASGSLEASGFAGVTVFEQQLPTAGVIIAIANAHMLGTLGRVDEAAAAYRSLGPPAAWVPSPHAILPAFAFGISLAIVLGLDDDVAVLRERLSAYRAHHVVSGAGQVAYFGPVELALGRAAARIGRLDEAAIDLQRAAEICAANGAAGYEVEAQCELAAVFARRKQIADARALLQVVVRRSSELGMTPFTQRAHGLMNDLSNDGPLTPREWEVAELVARGMTNREIAETLVLSERTAQNHVQHVLTKLGLANRSQIAAWMARLSTQAE